MSQPETSEQASGQDRILSDRPLKPRELATLSRATDTGTTTNDRAVDSSKALLQYPSTAIAVLRLTEDDRAELLVERLRLRIAHEFVTLSDDQRQEYDARSERSKRKNPLEHYTLVDNRKRKITVHVGTQEEVSKKLLSQVDKEGAAVLKRKLKLAPELVEKELMQAYDFDPQSPKTSGRRSVRNGPYPYVNGVEVNEKTLRKYKDDDYLLNSFAGIRAQLRAEVHLFEKNTAGTTLTNGSIFLVKDYTLHTLAHELLHAFSHDQWEEFLLTMRAREMKDTWRINEGVTALLAQQVVDHARKEFPELLPGGITYDTKTMDMAEKFLDKVGAKRVAAAYFHHGMIAFPSEKPENNLFFGYKSVTPEFDSELLGQNWAWPTEMR